MTGGGLVKRGSFSVMYWTAPYSSSVLKILRKENKFFQDLRISADLADSALEYRGIFEGWKVGWITYLKIYIKIKVNTMYRDYNGRRAFDLSGKTHFSADSVIFANRDGLYRRFSYTGNWELVISIMATKFRRNHVCFYSQAGNRLWQLMALLCFVMLW